MMRRAAIPRAMFNMGNRSGGRRARRIFMK
jgi:hypothetical protein